MKKMYLILTIAYTLPMLSSGREPNRCEPLKKDQTDFFVGISDEEIEYMTQQQDMVFVYVPENIVLILLSLSSIIQPKDHDQEYASLLKTLDEGHKIASYHHILNYIKLIFASLQEYDADEQAEFISDEEMNDLIHYSKDLTQGNALIKISEEEYLPTQSKKIKIYCNLLIKNCLKANNLLIRGQTKMMGNLTVENSVHIAKDAIIDGDLTIHGTIHANNKRSPRTALAFCFAASSEVQTVLPRKYVEFFSTKELGGILLHEKTGFQVPTDGFYLITYTLYSEGPALYALVINPELPNEYLVPGSCHGIQTSDAHEIHGQTIVPLAAGDIIRLRNISTHNGNEIARVLKTIATTNAMQHSNATITIVQLSY